VFQDQAGIGEQIMARQRMIKAEFWADETLNECSMTARLLFIATWNFADDEGNLSRSAKQLKAQAFPYDIIDCEPLLLELISHGLLIEYSVSEKKYLNIPNFKKHQIINRPSKPHCPLYEHSLRTHPEVSKEVSKLDIEPVEVLADIPEEKTKQRTFGADDVFPQVKDRKLIAEWLKVRKTKRLALTETAIGGVAREVEKSGKSLEAILKLCVEKSWGGFEASFLKNVTLPVADDPSKPFDVQAWMMERNS